MPTSVHGGQRAAPLAPAAAAPPRPGAFLFRAEPNHSAARAAPRPQVRVIDRVCEIPHEGPFCDLMWSDPEDIDTWAVSPRGAGWLFGRKVTAEFNEINGAAAGRPPARRVGWGALSARRQLWWCCGAAGLLARLGRPPRSPRTRASARAPPPRPRGLAPGPRPPAARPAPPPQAWSSSAARTSWFRRASSTCSPRRTW